jgi:hypothetical protein
MAGVTQSVVPDGPIRTLFDELRVLHRAAGEPSTRTIAKAVAHSHGAVHSALRGPRVPRWGLLELIVEELDGDCERFRGLWIEARNFEDPFDRQVRGPVDHVFHAVQAGLNNPAVAAVRTVAAPEGHHSRDLPIFTASRIGESLDRLDIRYMQDAESAVLAMWDRHAVLIAAEGLENEILMIRARPHAAVRPDHLDAARLAVNEWNHTRRFMKVYIGDPAARGESPLYGEIQIPLVSGVSDAQIDEYIDCGVSVAQGLVEWLYDESDLFRLE